MVFFVSCSEEKTKNVTLDVSPSTLNYSVEGGPVSLIITSDGDWNISEIPDWITLSSVSGRGDGTVTVTAKKNETGVLRQHQIVIRSGDNHRIIPVLIVQSAGSSYNDYGLAVTDGSERYLSGAMGSTDSVYIESNVQWVLEGPKWIQVAFKGVNVPLDGKTQCSGSGNLIIMGLDNDSPDDRSDKLTIRSTADDKKIEITVTQMGALNVRPVMVMVMANSYTFVWKYGMFVKYLFYDSFEGTATANNKTLEAALKYEGFVEVTPTTLCSFKNRKANTNYEICGLGVAADKGTYNKVCSINVKTPTDQNQPLAIISDATFDSQWHYKVTLNDFATGYYTYILSTKYADLSDSYIAFLMKRSLEKRSFYEKGGTFSVNTTDDMHIVTWAVGANGNFSTVLSRYTANKSGTANALKSESGKIIEIEGFLEF